MRVTVTGATGTIGRALVRELVARGDEVTALSRNPARAQQVLGAGERTAGAPRAGAGRTPERLDAGAGRTPERLDAGAGRTPERLDAGAGRTPERLDAGAERTPEPLDAGAQTAGEPAAGATRGTVEALEWADPKGTPPPADALRGHDAVVHLLGEQLAQRWSESARREIRDSRVLATRNLVAAFAELPEAERPRVLISQSAVGWYGAHGAEPITESQPAAGDFLARVTADWEAEARAAERLGVRVAITRTGVVLSESGGALEKMLPFFKLGIGGPVAGGRQYVPWVHLDDVVGALAFTLDTPAAAGPLNVTAPEPVTNRELSRSLGRVLRRPAFAPVPALAVKALYGEMATIVITGVRAVPSRLQQLGYRFRRPELESALRDATGRG